MIRLFAINCGFFKNLRTGGARILGGHDPKESLLTTQTTTLVV